MIQEDASRFETAWHAAASNWSKWRDDYNWDKGWKKRPLLNSVDRFSDFCTDYSLARNIPGNPSYDTEKEASKRSRAARLRRRVVARYFREWGEPSDERDVESVAKCLAICTSRNTCGLPNLLTASISKQGVAVSPSLVSKVWCFSDPVRFPPMDRLNKAALRHNGRYAEFREKFEEAHRSLWEAVANYVDLPELPSFVSTAPCKKEAFFWRVTDNYLMIKGSQRERSTSTYRQRHRTAKAPLT